MYNLTDIWPAEHSATEYFSEWASLLCRTNVLSTKCSAMILTYSLFQVPRHASEAHLLAQRQALEVGYYDYQVKNALMKIITAEFMKSLL